MFKFLFMGIARYSTLKGFVKSVDKAFVRLNFQTWNVSTKLIHFIDLNEPSVWVLSTDFLDGVSIDILIWWCIWISHRW